MPIYARDAAALDAQASEGARNTENNDAKLKQLILGKNLDMQKANEMVDVNQQNEQNKSNIDVGAQKSKQDNDLATIQKLSDSGVANEGGSISANGVTVGKGYDTNRMLQKQQGMSDKAIKDATDAYTKALPKIQDQFNAASEGMQLANDPKNIGSLGQARTLMLKSMGMNRYNSDEASAVLPPALKGMAANMFNAAGGDEAPLNDSQRATINTFFKGMAQTAHDKHESLKQNTLGSYQLRNGYDANKAEGLKSGVMGNFDKSYGDKMKQFDSLPTTAPAPGAPAPSGPMDKLAEFFGRGRAQPAAQAAPQGGGMQDAIAQEIARRKGAQPPMTFQEFQARKKAGTL
jgi:hypothetical protein